MFCLEDLRRSAGTRRAFIAAMSVAGLGLAAENLLAGQLTLPTPPTAGGAASGVPTDGATQFAGIPGANINLQAANFALTLENLEADLYRQALNLASGLALTTPLNSNSGVYTQKVGNGGLNSSDAGALYVYLKEFAYVEAAHRDFLRVTIPTLGGTPVPPNPRGYNFGGPVAANIAAILEAILPLEETGVRAYLGALPYITNLGVAQTAATIFSTEARHSAAISYRLGIDPGPSLMKGDYKVIPAYPSQNTLEYYLPPKAVLAAASKFFN